MLPRRLTSRARVLPDYLVIGAQKAGTTSLYYYLVDHPHVAAALEEEVHFFDLNYGRGLGWYRAHFPLGLGEGRIVGESTPYYLFHPHVPQRVRQVVPDAKLIVLLRNPVDRAYSHYQHSVRQGREPLSFEESIEVEEERIAPETRRLLADEGYNSFVHQHQSYLARGLYLDQLKAWRALFPEEQMLVLSAEEFRADTSAVFGEILRFLELPPCDLKEYRRYNAWSYPKMEASTRRYLVDYFRPHNEKLYEYLSRSFDWDH